jgi:arsenite methyltransferase
MSHSDKDQWFEWLLHRRFGGDEQAMNEAMAMLVPIRDRVLDNARLEAGSVVLDVGTGDGLIAFGALERVGKSGRVIFCDISEDLVAHCQTLAREMGVSERCEFVVAPAEDLRATASGSVDAVTVRSVLIYVKDKLAAFREFFRVLKTGGTVSLFEPVNRFCYDPSPDWFWGYHVAPVQSAALKVRQLYERLQPPDSDPMLDFDERTLLALAEEAGFGRVALDLSLQVEPMAAESWETLTKRALNPKIPTLEEAMAQALSDEEAGQFTQHLRPLVENGVGISRSATVYLSAVKLPA